MKREKELKMRSECGRGQKGKYRVLRKVCEYSTLMVEKEREKDEKNQPNSMRILKNR